MSFSRNEGLSEIHDIVSVAIVATVDVIVCELQPGVGQDEVYSPISDWPAVNDCVYNAVNDAAGMRLFGEQFDLTTEASE